MTFTAFWHGCWFGHSETIWEGQHFRCLTCGTRIDVLPQATVRGPAAIPEPVRGTPITKVYPTEKVAPITRETGKVVGGRFT